MLNKKNNKSELLVNTNKRINESLPIHMNVHSTQDKTNEISFSMYRDTNKQLNLYGSNNTHNSLNVIQSRKLYDYVDDNSVTTCYHCNTIFNLFIRKHHCRCCGRIFCYKCCSNWIKIPINSHILSIRSHLYENNDENIKQRICNKCLIITNKVKNLEKLINVFNLLNLTIKDYRKMKGVCKSWMNVSNLYLSSFREIQYYLPNHEYTKYEKKMLMDNITLFPNHSKLIVKLIKSLDWNNIDISIEKKILKLLYYRDSRTCECWTLMCTRNCSNNLSSEDALELLYPKIVNRRIRKYALTCLECSSINELTCFIPFLVHHIQYELHLCNENKECLITGFLIKKMKINKTFALYLYWELVEQSQIYDYELINHYDYIKNLITDCHKIDITDTNNLINILISSQGNNNITQIRNKISKSKCSLQNIPFPFTNNSVIDTSNLEIKNSATKPILFEYHNNLHKKNKILFKFEDVRKDKMIMNIIKLINIILKNNGIHLNFVTYDIIPVTAETGFISIVPNSHTLYDVENSDKFTLQNYIIEKNKNSNISTIRNNFIRSCAGCCIIGYLLGLGDRHLENIMITDDGLLFHIDFSYILGENPNNPKSLMIPEMVITTEMINSMGGFKSIGYKKFKKLCSKAYNCLRRHSSILISNLLMLNKLSPSIDNGRYTEVFITKQVIKRLCLGECYKEAELQYVTKIIKSSKSNRFVDFCHYHKKETIDKVVNFVSNTVTNIYSFVRGSNHIE